MPLPPGSTTGEVRFRKTLFGKLVLQVQHSSYRDEALGGPTLYWQDAVEHDLSRVRSIRQSKNQEPLI